MWSRTVSAVIFISTLLVSTAVVHADPNPNTPGPGEVFIEGQSCLIAWDADSTGVWKDMQIDFMTGDNLNMVFLTTVATNIDATNPSKLTFSYPCPKVTPHSPIYFYQFSSSATSNKSWTGRFTITDATSDITAPSQSTQPDGQKIPWGTGSLVNGSAAAPAGSSTASAAASTSATASAGGGALASSTSSSTSAKSTPSASGQSSTTGDVVYVTTYLPDASSDAAAAASSTAGTNGAPASLSHSVFSTTFQSGVLGLAALGLALMF